MHEEVERRELLAPMLHAFGEAMGEGARYVPDRNCPAIPGKVAIWDLTTADVTDHPSTWGVRDTYRPIPLQSTDAITLSIADAAAVVFVRNGMRRDASPNHITYYNVPGKGRVIAMSPETCLGVVEAHAPHSVLCGRCFYGDYHIKVPEEQVPYEAPPNPNEIANWLQVVFYRTKTRPAPTKRSP